MTMPEAGKTAEIRIVSEERTTVLDGQGGVLSVCYELAARQSRQAQPSEHVQAGRTVCEQARVGARRLRSLSSALIGWRSASPLLRPLVGDRNKPRRFANGTAGATVWHDPCDVGVHDERADAGPARSLAVHPESGRMPDLVIRSRAHR